MNTPQGIRDYLTLVVQRGGSDLHLTVNAPPAARVNGNLQALEDFHLNADQVRELIIGTMNETQRARLDEEWELDFQYTLTRKEFNEYCSYLFKRIKKMILKTVNEADVKQTEIK